MDDQEATGTGPVDSLVEAAVLNRTVRLLAGSEGVTLMELRAIVAATDGYPADSMVRVVGVALCEDDDGAGEHWINGLSVTELAQQESRGDITKEFWPWATEWSG